MKLSVYGSGCPTCKKLYDLAQKAAAEIDSKIKVEYIGGQEGIKKIIELGAMSSPVLAVDGKIAMTGFISDISKIKTAILKAAKQD